MSPACGPPSSLSPLIGDDVDPRAQTGGDRGFAVHADAAQIEEFAAAQVFHHRDVVLAPQRHQLFQRRLLGEADDLEIRAMHAQQKPVRSVMAGS